MCLHSSNAIVRPILSRFIAVPGPSERNNLSSLINKMSFTFLTLFTVALSFFIFSPALAYADEGHGEAAATIGFSNPVVLVGGIVILFLVLALPVTIFYLQKLQKEGEKPRKGFAEYFYRVSQFSRNARLYLGQSLLTTIVQGVWAVLFNLYLLASGFDVRFVGYWLMVNMLFHGLMSLPAGVLADHIGRRNTLIIGNLLQIISRIIILFMQDPTALLIMAAIVGLGDGFHIVAGAPFLMEHSEPRERAHLFSLDAALMQISRMGGSFLGGTLPLLFAASMGVSIENAGAQRLALAASLPLNLIALIPTYLMKEKKLPSQERESLIDILRLKNIKNLNIIGKLFLTTIFFGLGFGFTISFFNVFFHEAYHATPDEVGLVMALGGLVATLFTLLNPYVVRKWGMVKGTALTQVLSLPFLIAMSLMPTLSLAVPFFFLYRGLWSFAFPLRSQFSMELVSPRERGTTNGVLHMTTDLMGSPAAALAGISLATGMYFLPYSIASLSFLIPAILWVLFFGEIEKKRKRLSSDD